MSIDATRMEWGKNRKNLHDLRRHDDRIDSTNDCSRGSCCIDAVAALDDGSDAFPHAAASPCDGCCGGPAGAGGAYGAGVGSVAMANYAHCGVNATNVAYRLDDDGDEAYDLAMLPSTSAECALQIEPFRCLLHETCRTNE